MKFIPLPFSTPMVQAVKDDRKTKTRRLKGLDDINYNPCVFSFIKMEGDYAIFGDASGNSRETVKRKCPYGQAGDVLWVKENILCHPDYSSKDHKAGLCGPLFLPNGENVAFRGWVAEWQSKHPVFKVIPSMFMPKQACRFFLEVVSIRVERLQDISEEDAKAEGVEKYLNAPGKNWYIDYREAAPQSPPANCFMNARQSFKSLWIKINGAESLEANPWVWVVEFKKIEKPENFLTNEPT